MATISLNKPGSDNDPGPTTEIIYNAPIKWAQKSDGIILLTIDLHDVTEESVELTDNTLAFQGISDGKIFACNLNFYKPIISEKSTYEVHPRSIQFHLKKRGEKIVGAGDCSGKSKSKVASVDFVEAWPHLLNDKSLEVNKYDISVDWSHFEDME